MLSSDELTPSDESLIALDSTEAHEVWGEAKELTSKPNQLTVLVPLAEKHNLITPSSKYLVMMMSVKV